MESTASILASVKEQEAQFEKLTRALEEERRHVSAQLERVRVSPQDASPGLANGTLTRRHQVKNPLGRGGCGGSRSPRLSVLPQGSPGSLPRLCEVRAVSLVPDTLVLYVPWAGGFWGVQTPLGHGVCWEEQLEGPGPSSALVWAGWRLPGQYSGIFSSHPTQLLGRC